MKGFRWFRWLMVLVLMYMLGTVGYYFVPWSIRRSVHKSFPKLNRTLTRTGFRIAEEWDGLGLWGRDCATLLNGCGEGEHVCGGYPLQGVRFFDRIKVLENESHVVGYSESMKAPLWVAYRVFDVPHLEAGRRPSFRMDYRTEAKVSPRDYRGTGYDRGHMAPNHAIATRYGVVGQRETFLMSNIIPQVPGVNRYIWKDLEMRVSRSYGRYLGEVWVITGPVFTKPVERLGSGVAVPAGYYKIIADEDGDELRVMAFLVKRGIPPYTRIKSQLVSVDKLEELTGLNFFPDLSGEMQADLESRPAGRLWPWLLPAIQYSLNQ
ncbi:MAG: DNA/RNA non-specific endonuclease [Verrucomicrobiota bacterium]